MHMHGASRLSPVFSGYLARMSWVILYGHGCHMKSMSAEGCCEPPGSARAQTLISLPSIGNDILRRQSLVQGDHHGWLGTAERRQASC